MRRNDREMVKKKRIKQEKNKKQKAEQIELKISPERHFASREVNFSPSVL